MPTTTGPGPWRNILVFRADRSPVPAWPGRYLVIVDSQRVGRAPWSPWPGSKTRQGVPQAATGHLPAQQEDDAPQAARGERVLRPGFVRLRLTPLLDLAVTCAAQRKHNVAEFACQRLEQILERHQSNHPSGIVQHDESAHAPAPQFVRRVDQIGADQRITRSTDMMSPTVNSDGSSFGAITASTKSRSVTMPTGLPLSDALSTTTSEPTWCCAHQLCGVGGRGFRGRRHDDRRGQ